MPEADTAVGAAAIVIPLEYSGQGHSLWKHGQCAAATPMPLQQSDPEAEAKAEVETQAVDVAAAGALEDNLTPPIPSAGTLAVDVSH